MLKPLYVGPYTFRDMIEGGYLYVDKTKWIYELVKYPKGVYFLSRPRRFGKSLLISTLRELFLGNRALFKGLWIEQTDYQWNMYPVIHINFSEKIVRSAEELEENLTKYILHVAQQYGVTIDSHRYYDQFAELIRKMSTKGQVVILIDEYDKPLISNLSDMEEAKKIRDVLKGFYVVIKAMDRHLRFVLLTGVSKFSKVGVFSDLNNLDDLTMSPDYSAFLGITQEELERDFTGYITRLALREQLREVELLQKIRAWYNGFCFSERCQTVYNPYSLLLLFKHRRFSNYWFESGTPTFLLNLIKEQEYDVKQIEKLTVGESAFSSYEIDRLDIVPILFQTGYLTIKGYNKRRRLYDLHYPNYEVENAFSEYLLSSFGYLQKGESDPYLWQLVDALTEEDFDEFFGVLEVFFANIPYEMHLKYEAYYQTILYLVLKQVGLKVLVEQQTNRGRIDTVVMLETRIIIFEFKLDGNAEEALKQIKEKGYAERYRLSGKEIILVGVNFDTKVRGVEAWKVVRDEAS